MGKDEMGDAERQQEMEAFKDGKLLSLSVVCVFVVFLIFGWMPTVHLN